MSTEAQDLLQRAKEWLAQRKATVPNYQDFPEEGARSDERTAILSGFVALVERLSDEQERRREASRPPPARPRTTAVQGLGV